MESVSISNKQFTNRLDNSKVNNRVWLFQVRGAAVFSLGTFISSIASRDRSDHARLIDQTVAITLATKVTHDGSPLVRQVSITFVSIIVCQCLLEML